MQLKHLSLMLPAILAAQAVTFTIPAGQADGLYVVDVDADGNSVGGPVLLSAAPNITARAVDVAPQTIPRPQVGCRGYSYNSGDYAAAVNCLNKWCDDGNRIDAAGILNTKIQYCKAGASVAYICNL